MLFDEPTRIATVLVFALLIDRYVIDPDWLWARLPHPVVGYGAIIAKFDERLPRGRRWQLIWGTVLVAVLAGLSLGIAALIWIVDFASILECLTVAVLLAQRSLRTHVERVGNALRQGVQQGREAVTQIVGRDVSRSNASGVSAAAIESLAENFSDGIVAPAFSYLIFGLPGILIFKAVNTADSMVGHRTRRHVHFGCPSARFDDVLCWVPARLTVFLLGPVDFGAVRRDAATHRSPNAGWPEAAMAYRLGIRLAGPRRYTEGKVDAPYLNADAGSSASPEVLAEALRIYRAALNKLLAFAAGAAVLAHLLDK